MGITGGFGITIDLERGTSRKWVIGRDGIKRWADNGYEIKTCQHDFVRDYDNIAHCCCQKCGAVTHD